MRDIGKNIRDLRTRKELTQDELAERLFVTRQTVSNYETGKSKPDVEMLVKISEALNTDVQQLIYGVQPTATDQQRKQLIVGTVVTAGFLAVFLLIRPIAAAWQQDYFASLNMFNHILFLSVALIAAGWTVGQLIGMALRRQPLDYAWVKYARITMVVILAVLLGLNILSFGSVTLNDWLYMHELRGQWVEKEVTNLATGETYTSLHYDQLPVQISEWLQIFSWNYFMILVYRHIWIFSFAGAGLWLLGFPKQKVQNEIN